MLDRLHPFVVSTRQSSACLPRLARQPGAYQFHRESGAGRSGHCMTDLAKKLGMKPGDQVCLLDAPPEAVQLLHAVTPPGVDFSDLLGEMRYDLILFWPGSLEGPGRAFYRAAASHPSGWRHLGGDAEKEICPPPRGKFQLGRDAGRRSPDGSGR